ncbi:MAG: dihydrolipoamide acetyltransferase family protein [Armatimonadota bacterium]
MAEIFRLPQMGQTMTEATILRWIKSEGDRVESWEGMVEMMTDKINMEVEPQITGTILKLLADQGAVVPVGAPIAIIGQPGEDISGLVAELAGGAPPAAEAAPGAAAEAVPVPSISPTAPLGIPNAPSVPSAPVVPGEIPSVSPRAREAAAEAGIDWKSLQLEGTGFEGMVAERDVLAFLESAAARPEILATPLAAKMADDLGVSLEDLVGSGPRGRVRAEDVRGAAARRRRPAIEPREIPLQGMRKVIASRLAASYQGAVHVPLRAEVDMTAAAELRRQLKPELEARGARVTYTDLIAAAVCSALVTYPLLNGTLENDVIRVHGSVNLGIAVALDEGLTVPVVPAADALPLPELSVAIQDLAKRARTGQLPPDAYAGGTFTITNLGAYGVESFDPIINPPQVAILGVGSIQDRIVAVNGAPAVRPMMTLTLSFDHRAMDGAPAAQALARIKELLENPARLLI